MGDVEAELAAVEAGALADREAAPSRSALLPMKTNGVGGSRPSPSTRRRTPNERVAPQRRDHVAQRTPAICRGRGASAGVRGRHDSRVEAEARVVDEDLRR